MTGQLNTGTNMNKRQKIFTALLALLFLVFSALLIYFSLSLSQANKTLRDKIDQLQISQPQDGHTPTDEELLALIRPLIPNPVTGASGVNGLSIKGDKGDSIKGNDGSNAPTAQPCTTYTDENNNSYIGCPDGTETLIQQPDQPRQIELCTTSTIPLGWKYVGTINCQKVKGS